ncbi:hypothetical protein P7H16_13940 [Paenibacillus larvae]|nr:hypothetical protein [Paenibacillus larvae]MDT2247798.1 hypothetical protein [Paenibacillus larvae]MDT2254975.1 hypothetical protein [Paenibacillus larvae]MDT2264159.1 hypothetical protein [Paenibacillus larvae]MDT2276654.1 hypothetical protein [Paenibacillus larvae]
MNKKQTGILLVIIVFVVLITSIFFIQQASEKKEIPFPIWIPPKWTRFPRILIMRISL